ncbi:MAG: undecaprenyl-diphosphate phosphatase [Pseudomonadota bacterium]
MDSLQLIVLAVVQGITEFLPISSSGHLVLVPLLTDWPDQGLLIDVAVHVGSLGAVVLYLWRDLAAMLGGTLDWRSPGLLAHPARRLIALVVAATLPVVVAGAVLAAIGTDGLRRLDVIAWTMILFGILLYVVDQRCRTDRKLETMSFGGALLIGSSQILALIPGTSRAGITMTAARWLGYDRTESARFSMLLSIPTILAAGALMAKDLYELGELAVTRDAALGAILAFVSAFAAIIVMMRWLRTASFTPFVVYRLVLGVVLLGVAYLA